MRSPSAQGRRELQEAIAEHLYHFRGCRWEPEQIVIGVGTEYLYGLLVQFLAGQALRRGRAGLPETGQIYESRGARSVAIPMDDAGVQADAGVRGRGRAPHLSLPTTSHRHRHAGQPPL